jgi:hypothetical protein
MLRRILLHYRQLEHDEFSDLEIHHFFRCKQRIDGFFDISCALTTKTLLEKRWIIYFIANIKRINQLLKWISSFCSIGFAWLEQNKASLIYSYDLQL